ncbi:MAG: GNAT family N-acetyltransferase [Acidothermus sp.]|nr:GNAT family N-acetyltransferase [Acidothermus sp.]MCL6538121.1 GNAT family N-acetyltransferase [Acidothermus sp.]
MVRGLPVRVLDDRDVAVVRDILDRDPVANVFVASRVASCGVDPWRLGAEIWGYVRDGRITALCYSGANLVPVGADAEACEAFAEKARRQGRRCSSLVGPAQQVAWLWAALEGDWGPARDVRPNQPLMAISDPPRIPPDPFVRRVRPDELELLFPACVAMFEEEVGVSPVESDGGALYRARVAELISQGRAFARIEDGRVVFKAEVGAATAEVCQVQGVWVEPSLRGRGLSNGGMAAVVLLAQRHIAPVVSLYVNDYNLPARAAYKKVGFAEVGTFMSVLF